MITVEELNFEKLFGLVPAVVQDSTTDQVLMVGFMNEDALRKTIETQRVTFFSRSRGELWTKGETSGNFLDVVAIDTDCDRDTLLIRAVPHGNTCHKGTYSCFGEKEESAAFLLALDKLIAGRKMNRPENSYTTKLFDAGKDRIAQKVGEEAVETVIAALSGNKKNTQNEAADLLFHLIVLLNDMDISFTKVVEVLEERHASSIIPHDKQ